MAHVERTRGLPEGPRDALAVGDSMKYPSLTERLRDRNADVGVVVTLDVRHVNAVENRSIALNYKNLTEITVNYYLMDPEFSFSSSPFVSEDSSRFSIVKPTKIEI